MPGMTQLVIDLDGPLLDGSARHYHCYRAILEQFGFPVLNRESYWEAKRNRTDRRELLKRSNAETLYETYQEQWLSMIESPEALALDVLQEGALKTVRYWKSRGFTLTLATLRHDAAALHAQLARLELNPFFDHIVASPHEKGAEGKAAAVKAVQAHSAVWIGDTEIDYEAACKLGCDAVLVTNGVRSEEYLRTLQDARIVPSIITLKDVF